MSIHIILLEFGALLYLKFSSEFFSSFKLSFDCLDFCNFDLKFC